MRGIYTYIQEIYKLSFLIREGQLFTVEDIWSIYKDERTT